MVLTVLMDADLDSILIELEAGTAGYAKELDDDRIIDYSLNPGTPIGVSLHNVSQGVNLDGLPEPERIGAILNGLGVETRNKSV